MSELLTARGLSRSYRTGGGRLLEVLRGLDLEVGRGEVVAIVGESGVGKSTLLHLLGALDRPDSGSYLFEGRAVFEGSADDLARFRNRDIGFVFQFHHLLAEFTACENVMLPGLMSRESPPAVLRRARRLLEEMGLGGREDQLPAELSGGEQQRVAIARALMTSRSLLLADEPTGNLDPATAMRVFEVMKQVQGSRGLAVVLATHSERLAGACDRILRLRDGVLSPVQDHPGVPHEAVRP